MDYFLISSITPIEGVSVSGAHYPTSSSIPLPANIAGWTTFPDRDSAILISGYSGLLRVTVVKSTTG